MKLEVGKTYKHSPSGFAHKIITTLANAHHLVVSDQGAIFVAETGERVDVSNTVWRMEPARVGMLDMEVATPAPALPLDDEPQPIYVVDTIYKTWTEDTWDDGERGRTQETTIDRIGLKHRSLQAVIRQACSFLGADLCDAEVSEDDQGLVRLSILEDDNGHEVRPSSRAWQDWKDGRRRLWSCQYEFSVKQQLGSDVPADQLRQAMEAKRGS